MSRLVAALVILAGFVVAIVLLVLLIAPVLTRQFRRFHRTTRRAMRSVCKSLRQRSRAIPGSKRSSATIWSAPTNRSAIWSNKAVGYLTGFLGRSGRRAGLDFDLFTGDHHAGGRVLSDLRLGQHGGYRRSAGAAARSATPCAGLRREIDATISAYVRGQSGLCLILGSYYAVGLTLAGLNFGLLIGVVSGLISFIPYVGSLTALMLSLTRGAGAVLAGLDQHYHRRAASFCSASSSKAMCWRLIWSAIASASIRSG